MDPVCALLSITTAGMGPGGKCCRLHGGTESGWRGRHRYSQDKAVLRVGWTALRPASLWTDGVKFLTARSGNSHKDIFKFLTRIIRQNPSFLHNIHGVPVRVTHENSPHRKKGLTWDSTGAVGVGSGAGGELLPSG